MITKKELIEISTIKNLKPYQQEKHYIQSSILIILSDYPLIFKGGTYLWFFHSLNRFSTDLDFTLYKKELEIKSLKEFTNKLKKDIERKLYLLNGINAKAEIKKTNKFSIKIKVSAKGPLFTTKESICFIDIDISHREKILLEPDSYTLDFSEYNLPIKIIRGINLKEIFAEKIRAVYTRKKGRDIYDIWFLVNKKNIKITKEITQIINKKLNIDSINKQKFTKKTFKKNLYDLKDYFIKDMYEIKLTEIKEFDKYYKEIIENIF